MRIEAVQTQRLLYQLLCRRLAIGLNHTVCFDQPGLTAIAVGLFYCSLFIYEFQIFCCSTLQYAATVSLGPCTLLRSTLQQQVQMMVDSLDATKAA